MDRIEQQVWDYIDGLCPDDERVKIASLIENDMAYRQKYLELIQLNQAIASMEADEPSMGFTYKVMEGIRKEQVQKPLKTAIDQRIIMGLSTFFLLTIAGVLVYVLMNVNWQQGNNNNNLTAPIILPQLQHGFTTSIIRGVLMADVILALFLLNGWVRKYSDKITAL
jgi:anti-sigma factor RsiW